MHETTRLEFFYLHKLALKIFLLNHHFLNFLIIFSLFNIIYLNELMHYYIIPILFTIFRVITEILRRLKSFILQFNF